MILNWIKIFSIIRNFVQSKSFEPSQEFLLKTVNEVVSK